jgi:HlyD family secretion protein
LDMNLSRPEKDPEFPEPLRTSSPVNRKTVFTSIFVLLLLIACYFLLRPSSPEVASPEEAKSFVVSVHAAKAERQSIALETTAVGTLSPREQAIVSPKISSQIKKMGLVKNRAVRAGETVAVLESRDLQAQRAEAMAALQQAQLSAKGIQLGTIPQANAQAEKDLRDARANLINARALYERRRALYEQGGIALKEVEAAQLALTTAENALRLAEQSASLRTKTLNVNDLAVAQAQVKAAQDRVANLDAQLSYTLITAPFTGVITDQFQYEGEFATAGGKLFTIADLSEMIVKVPFADVVVAQLKVGDDADVLPTDLPEEKFTGRITLISRSTDPQNRSVEIWVNLKNPGGRLRANGAAKVVVHANAQSEALVVPASAVALETTNSSQGTVFVIDENDVANERKVIVGIKTSDLIEIVSGLQEGETVITEGNFALPDKTKVQVSADEGESEKSEEGKGEDKSDSKSGEKGDSKSGEKGDSKAASPQGGKP